MDGCVRVSLMHPVTARNDGETFVSQPEQEPHMDWKRETPDIEFGAFPTFLLAPCDNPLSRVYVLSYERILFYIPHSVLRVKCTILCDPGDESKFNRKSGMKSLYLYKS